MTDLCLSRRHSSCDTLTVYNRFAMIIAVLTVVFIAALAAQVRWSFRSTVIDERRNQGVRSGRRRLRRSCQVMRKKPKPARSRRMRRGSLPSMQSALCSWGKSSDYLGVHGAGSTNAGVTYVHANPKQYIARQSLGLQGQSGSAKADPEYRRQSPRWRRLSRIPGAESDRRALNCQMAYHEMPGDMVTAISCWLSRQVSLYR